MDTKSLRVAYYVTGHGLGHATRVAEICKCLLRNGHTVHVATAAPEWIFKQGVSDEDVKRLYVVKVVLDNGAKQADALSVDRLGSLEEYMKTSVEKRTQLLDTEVAWLSRTGIDVVISDIVPLACAASEKASIPCICVTNFSWDFVYAEYLTAIGRKNQDFGNLVWQIAEDYSKAKVLLRLPGYCPMPAFRDVQDVPLVVRMAVKTRTQVREELGISQDQKMVLYQFGGQEADWELKAESLPAGWICMVASTKTTGPDLPPGFMRAPPDAYTPDLVNASDCILGKIGYGTTSESLAHNVPLVFVRRSYFNEEPFLRKLLEINNCMVEMSIRDFKSGHWSPYLEHALTIHPCYRQPLDGAATVARTVEEVAAGQFVKYNEKHHEIRLRDAIVFGYQLARSASLVSDQDNVEVPAWYTSGSCPADEAAEGARPPTPREVAVDVLYGSIHSLPDVEDFLDTLAALEYTDDDNLPEKKAARSLFRWDQEIVVARAPGRLDVMGGIADYSGSLVLEMPIKEACMVALQRQPPQEPSKQWKHTLQRHKAKHGDNHANVSTLRIVSFGADATNRAPTFDMDIQELYNAETGEPISYEDARQYFAADVARSWAAYAAGTLLVLMREKGLKVADNVSILVSSQVPEGKGVSSSASVEVATMQALKAAFHIDIPGRELAILCQMVENLVVGAPCGVMDQMTSACGEQGKLLALLCRPCEVRDSVTIPLHVSVWGIDSGVRHSVGGSDYGSVRVGAFMGRRMIKDLEAKAQNPQSPSDHPSDDISASRFPKAEVEHLTAIPPHTFERLYDEALVGTMKGDDFIAQHGSHDDKVTSVDGSVAYAVRSPTAHPVYEHFRVEVFSQLMKGPATGEQMRLLGELMYQSHESYSRCHLGSSGTDRLVKLVEEEPALYGAKITGGGSGGTVCVLGSATRESQDAITRVTKRYKDLTGHQPYVFAGSSPGAVEFGHLVVKCRQGRKASF